MKISLRVFSLIFLMISQDIYAQTTHRDSMIERAKIDAKMFHLNIADFQSFRKSGRKYNPQFFLPNKETASEPKLLSDSDYVKTFSEIAYKRTRRQSNIPLNITGGSAASSGVYVAVLCVVTVAATFFLVKEFQNGIGSTVK